MKIRMRPFDAKEIASRILSGEFPPETDSLEVIDALLSLTTDSDLTLFLDAEDLSPRRRDYPLETAKNLRAGGVDLRPKPRENPTSQVGWTYCPTCGKRTKTIPGQQAELLEMVEELLRCEKADVVTLTFHKDQGSLFRKVAP